MRVVTTKDRPSTTVCTDPKSHGRGARAWLGVALLGITLAASGCARRIPLTASELAEVQIEDAKDFGALRVYPQRRLRVYWLYKAKTGIGIQGADTDNKGRIVQTGERKGIRQRIKRGHRGKIIKIGELNGERILWVTFSTSCNEPKCSYGFVQVKGGKYLLTELPKRDNYKETVWRAFEWKTRKMKKGKRASLAEPNEVYLVKKKNGKLLTVELHVKKETRTKVEDVVDNPDGID